MTPGCHDGFGSQLLGWPELPQLPAWSNWSWHLRDKVSHSLCDVRCIQDGRDHGDAIGPGLHDRVNLTSLNAANCKNRQRGERADILESFQSHDRIVVLF